MTAVLWVQNLEMYQRLVREYSESVSRSTLLTADPSVIWSWQAGSIPYSSLWRFVTLSDQLDAAQEALELAETWLDDAEVLYDQNVHLASLCQKALLYTFRDALLAHRMALSFFAEMSPSSLILPATRKAALAGRDVSDVLLRWMAIKQGIPVETLTIADSKISWPDLSIINRGKRNLQSLIANQLWSLHSTPWHGVRQPTIVFFGGGADFVNQLHIIKQLRATRPYRIIHVSLNPVRASAYSRSQVLTQQRALMLLPYSGPRQYRRLRALGQQAWQWFRDTPLIVKDRYPALFHNPGLSSIIQYFFVHTVPRVGGVLGTAGQLLDACAPDLIVLNNDTSGREQAIVCAARQRGIPSAQLIHSGFNDLHVRQFSTDQIWVWGEAHRRQLIRRGVLPNRVKITGNPNYDYLAKAQRATAAMRAQVRQQLGLAENELALLMITAKSPHLLTFIDMERHILDLKTLCEALHSHPGVQLIIKPHPRYDEISIYSPLAEQYRWITLVKDILLDQLLPACDAAIMVNAVSTGGIEALMLAKPVVWIRASTRYPSLFSLFESVALTIDDRSQIAPKVDQFISSSDYRQSIANLGQQYLPALVAHSDGGATSTVIDVIDQMMQERQRE